jgi:hypothetical protein
MSILSLPHYSLLFTDGIRELRKGIYFPSSPSLPQGDEEGEGRRDVFFLQLPHIFQSFHYK